MAEPAPPIVLDDRGDITVFATVADAASCIEPIDADLGTYVAWDANGNRLTVESAGPRRPVFIRLDERSTPDPEALAARLRWFAGRLKRPDDEWVTMMQTASMPRLLEELQAATGSKPSRFRQLAANMRCRAFSLRSGRH